MTSDGSVIVWRGMIFCFVAASAVLLVSSGPSAALAQVRDAAREKRYDENRARMVEMELVREGIKNKSVLDSMRQVKRHLFVSPDLRDAAYFDQALPIGHKQTISPPFIVAYMTEMIDPQPTDRVLEIGTGSGYQAAVLAGLVKDVYTIEIVEPLGRRAAKVLKDQGYKNVHPLVGDGYKGWPEHAPFDKIIVTCSPENVPQPLIDQLRDSDGTRPGGKMIIPVGERYEQVFYLFEKKDGKLEKKKLLPALFVPMTGASEQQRQVRPDPAHPEVRNGGVETDSDADGHPDAWYYQRQLTLVQGTDAPEGKAYVTFQNSDPGRSAQMLQGMAVDGSKVGALRVSARIRAVDLKNGERPEERAALLVHFYDADRRAAGTEMIGPWFGTFDWKQVKSTLTVPSKAREAILRIGLNGATGALSVDDIHLTPEPR